MLRTRAGVRAALHRIDDEDVRRGRQLVRRLRSDAPQVLYIGDSTTRWVAPGDNDRRRLDAMVGELIEPLTLYSLYGGGYQGLIYEALISLVAATPARPLIIVPLCSRNSLPSIAAHPVYRRDDVLKQLMEVTASTPTWRIRSTSHKPTVEEFEQFYTIPFPTLHGSDTVIGDYAGPLRDPNAFRDRPADRERLLYAYHQTGVLNPDEPAVEAVTRLGAAVHSMGCRLIAYETPAPVERTVAHFGEAARQILTRNFEVLRRALLRGHPEALLVESGVCFDTDEFIDPPMADEHLNERGRRHLAQMIADAVSTAAHHAEAGSASADELHKQ